MGAVSAFDMLRHPYVSLANLIPMFPNLGEIDPAIMARIDIEGESNGYASGRVSCIMSEYLSGNYASHLRRQQADVKLFHDEESLLLAPDLDYQEVVGISEEVRERLTAVRPASIVSYGTVVSNIPVLNSDARRVWRSVWRV